MITTAPNDEETTNEPESYAAIAALLRTRPEIATSKSKADYEAKRVAWLFDMADALDTAGLIQDATSVRDTALQHVRTAVNALADGKTPLV